MVMILIDMTLAMTMAMAVSMVTVTMVTMTVWTATMRVRMPEGKYTYQVHHEPSNRHHLKTQKTSQTHNPYSLADGAQTWSDSYYYITITITKHV